MSTVREFHKELLKKAILNESNRHLTKVLTWKLKTGYVWEIMLSTMCKQLYSVSLHYTSSNLPNLITYRLCCGTHWPVAAYGVWICVVLVHVASSWVMDHDDCGVLCKRSRHVTHTMWPHPLWACITWEILWTFLPCFIAFCRNIPTHHNFFKIFSTCKIS